MQKSAALNWIMISEHNQKKTVYVGEIKLENLIDFFVIFIEYSLHVEFIWTCFITPLPHITLEQEIHFRTITIM